MRIRASRGPGESRLLACFLGATLLTSVCLLVFSAQLLDPFTEVPPTPAPTTRPTFTIGYCVYDQARRSKDPANHAKWVATWLGPHVFPERDLVLKPVTPLVSLLPSGVDPYSSVGLEMLGLTEDVDLRLCSFGSTEMMKIQSKLPGNNQTFTYSEAMNARLKKAGIQLDADRWSHEARVKWPEDRIAYVENLARKRPARPILARFSHEPWGEFVPYVPIQFETKMSYFSPAAVSVYFPMIVESFSWRWSDASSTTTRESSSKNFWLKRLGGIPHETPRELLRREPGFRPENLWSQKTGFAAMLHSHCGGSKVTSGTISSPAIREWFLYHLYNATHGRPIHPLGYCPEDPEGSTRLGLTPKARAAMRAGSKKSAVDSYRPYKFAIVFENSLTPGYTSEKLVSAYLAGSIPVYMGSSPALLARVVNPNAYVYCDLTGLRDADEVRLQQLFWRHCPRPTGTSYDATCLRKIEALVMPSFRARFDACAERILALDANDEAALAMLREPLGPYDESGELVGIWNATAMGQAVRAALVGLGYEGE